MISINLPKNLTFGMKLLYALLGVSIIVVIVAVIVFNRNTYLAKTMKLVRAEGTVKIEKEGGKLKPISKNSRFESGEALFTGLDGLATVSLDDTKFVTLKPDSRVEFSKINKQLGIKLTKGGMFFEVTEKLTEGEIFEIKTSTMTAGIKGTSGYFCLDADGNETLTVTDGKVIISAVNPETGERKYAEVSGGQRITVYLYSESTKDHDTIELDVKDVAEEDLEDFTIKMLCNDEKLLTKVCEYTGWDRQKLKELLNEILAAQVTPIPTESETSESESSSEESSSEDTEAPSSADNTPTPTPKPKDTDKPDPTATPKPNAKATD
ncbi:MAG: FecR domain-containing protein, partial [Lachnospiraceae bacterium]|nr:FecR domain-containing protein [Lachnospiraceae bacterium]